MNYQVNEVKPLADDILNVLMEIDGDEQEYHVKVEDKTRLCFERDLDVLLISKDFDYHRQLFNIITTVIEGETPNLPEKLDIPNQEYVKHKSK